MKQLNFKTWKVIGACLLVGTLVATIAQSCKVNKATAGITTFAPIYLVRTSPILIKHDTIKQKEISPEQWQKFIADQYQKNYQQFFKPEFDKQALSFSKLTESNSVLVNMYADLRQRSIKNTNTYRSKTDSLQHEITQLLLNDKQKVDEAVKQTVFLKKLVTLGLSVLVIFVIFCFVLFLYVLSLSKKTKKLVLLVNELKDQQNV